MISCLHNGSTFLIHLWYCLNGSQFRRRLESVVVDGKDIMAAARDRSLRSLSRLEAKDEAAKAATKREEERVAQLKKIRGEKWLPCIAREMQLKR